MVDPAQMLQTLLHFDQQLGSAIPRHGLAIYAILFAIVFVEIGVLPLFFLPGDPLIFISGAFCATGAINIWVLIPLFTVAAIGGSVTSYWTGRALGQSVMQKDRRWVNQNAVHQTQVFFNQHGSVTFLMSPFIAVVRTFAPFLAGATQMVFGRFLVFASGGAMLWALSLLGAGYFFGQVPLIRNNMPLIVLSGVVGGMGLVVLTGVFRAARRRRHRPMQP